MAEYRKLGKKTKLRKALLRNQVTSLIHNGKIVTTEARAKEIRKIVEPMITLAVKEKDNFENVTVKTKVARKDKDGKRVKQIIDKDTKEVLSESHRDADGKIKRMENGITVTVYDEVEKQIKKEAPSRIHARRQMMKFLYPVVEVPTEAAGRKKGTKEVDLIAKMFDEYGPKYAGRNGGYTRIVKIGQRRGDGALKVLLELV
ncbi:MAG: 50S ribosomal protein L17 [Lachnospiraceae bacterium]|nr:50S ribosomal protein L17 [Lachnospiraceae bacterium]